MKARLTVITEIIAPYRVPVFNALAARNDVELHVIFLAKTDPTLREWEVPFGEMHFSFEVLPSWRRRVGRYNILLNRGIPKALKAKPADVILCGGYNYLATWRAAYWARSHGVPFLLWLESTAADQRSERMAVESLKKRFLNLCRAFVVPGKSSAEYLRSLGVREEVIFTAPNAVDNDLFSTRAEAARSAGSVIREHLGLPERYFLNVGRLVRPKGVFDLLEAYAKLDGSLRREIGLVYVGDGAARPELEARAAKITPGRICFTGFVQKEQLPSYYAFADALVFPTHSDPWGLVVNEAMACSLPVITTSVAGCAADLMKDEWNGKVVHAQDPAQLAAAMEHLIMKPELKLVMSQRSRERIAAFSPHCCAAGIAHAAERIGVRS
jgi:glycosyltransferase involved in cell wall biosynthesis